MMGFVFPLFGRQMFNALGLGGGNSVCLGLSFLRCYLNHSMKLLAGLAIVLGIPFPVWVYYKGEAIRLNSKEHL